MKLKFASFRSCLGSLSDGILLCRNPNFQNLPLPFLINHGPKSIPVYVKGANPIVGTHMHKPSRKMRSQIESTVSQHGRVVKRHMNQDTTNING